MSRCRAAAWLAAAVLAAWPLLAAAADPPTPEAPPAVTAGVPKAAPLSWKDFEQRFVDDYLEAHPAFAANAGRHEFDGLLPDWSHQGIDAEIRRLEAWRTAAAGYADAQLDARQRFAREFLLAQVDGDLFWLRDVEWPYRNPAFYAWALDPSMYLSRPYGTPELRLRGLIAYLRAVPRACAQIRANLRRPLPASYIELGVNSFGGYARFFREDLSAAFAGVGDAALQASLVAAAEPAAAAMQALADDLAHGTPAPGAAFAIGAPALQRMLWMTERVDTPLDQLEALGRADLKRNLDALRLACAQFAPERSLAACVDQVNADKPTGGAVDGARQQLDQLRRFIVERRLVSIPGDDQAQVAEAPPYQRWNFAYIETPGPYEVGMPSIYRIAPADPAWPETERAAYTPGRSMLLFTSVHEVWPGHFLQFLHGRQVASPLGRVFWDYAFGEGWAHYAEEMMWDSGLGDGAPAVHIGQITEALLRDVRFACAVGLHSGRMTPEQCETMFREQAFQDPAGARQQAARGTFDPAYLNYTLGKLIIRNLRRDWIESHPQPQALRVFHDTLLSFGTPPLPLVREQMLGKEPPGSLFGR